MVRTKADRVPSKAVASKAPRKASTGTPVRKNNGRKNVGKSHGGGNPYHPRDTPEWQKPITSFMNTSSKTTTSNASPGKEKIENQASSSNCEDLNIEESIAEEDSETD
ncbi:PCNA-associated factor [Camponotus japonicus]